MEFLSLDLPGVFEIRPKKIGDARGFFSETWSEAAFAARGLPTHWVQDNHSFSAEAGVLRGLHFQNDPHAQDKLVRVVRGAIFDVAVDVRAGSPTFGRWAGLEVSAERWNQILVPKGFAHGFLTLEPDTEVVYKVTAPYVPQADRCVRWDDPAFAIKWPLDGRLPLLSLKDQAAPLCAQSDVNFVYAGTRS